jgi:transcriptional regulator with PAS, ATPase and Fis domain
VAIAFLGVETAKAMAGRQASLNLQQHLDSQRDARIRRALNVADNNKDEAAKLLGISRPTLYRELRRILNCKRGSTSRNEFEHFLSARKKVL